MGNNWSWNKYNQYQWTTGVVVVVVVVVVKELRRRRVWRGRK